MNFMRFISNDCLFVAISVILLSASFSWSKKIVIRITPAFDLGILQKSKITSAAQPDSQINWNRKFAQNWNGSEWVDSLESIQTLNSQNSILQTLSAIKTADNQWVNNSKDVWTRAEDGILALRAIYYIWDNNAWNESFEINWEYDSLKRFKTETSLMYIEGSEIRTNSRYTYNGDGKTDSIKTSSISSIEGESISYSGLGVWNYDTDGKWKSELLFQSAINDTVLKLYKRILYAFTDSTIQQTIETCDSTGTVWTPVSRSNIPSLKIGKTVTLNEVYKNGAWVNSDKCIDVHGFSGTLDTSIYQIWINNSWVNQERDIYYYSSDEVVHSNDGTNKNSKAALWLSSNNGHVMVHLNSGIEGKMQLKLYDFQGRTVGAFSEKIISGQKEIILDIDKGLHSQKLCKGNFICRILINNSVAVDNKIFLK